MTDIKKTLNSLMYGKKLIDFEWRFGRKLYFFAALLLVVTANSEIEGFNECALHLKLLFQNKTGKIDETYLRLSLSEFNEIFHEIEKIKNLV